MSFDTIHSRGGMVYEKCDMYRGLSFILGVALNHIVYFYPLDIKHFVSPEWKFFTLHNELQSKNGLIYRYCIP